MRAPRVSKVEVKAGPRHQAPFTFKILIQRVRVCIPIFLISLSGSLPLFLTVDNDLVRLVTQGSASVETVRSNTARRQASTREQ